MIKRVGVVYMKKISVQKLARVVRVLVIVLFVINLVSLVVLPSVIRFSSDLKTGEWIGVESGVRSFLEFLHYETDDALANVLLAPVRVFQMHPRISVLVIFLWVCGICSAVLLWQAKRVLNTIIAEDTFTFANAANMTRAAVCCFFVSVAALLRLIWSVVYYRSAMPLFSYNTLFIAVFAVAGLICIVMSALFRQAAELKAENDLTI